MTKNSKGQNGNCKQTIDYGYQPTEERGYQPTNQQGVDIKPPKGGTGEVTPKNSNSNISNNNR